MMMMYDDDDRNTQWSEKTKQAYSHTRQSEKYHKIYTYK